MDPVRLSPGVIDLPIPTVLPRILLHPSVEDDCFPGHLSAGVPLLAVIHGCHGCVVDCSEGPLYFVVCWFSRFFYVVGDFCGSCLLFLGADALDLDSSYEFHDVSFLP